VSLHSCFISFLFILSFPVFRGTPHRPRIRNPQASTWMLSGFEFRSIRWILLFLFGRRFMMFNNMVERGILNVPRIF
jgi:hypothetical protein